MTTAEPIAYGPLGLKPWEFERLTPGEFAAQLDGFRERREMDARDRIELAWTIAALSRQKKLPPLERLIRQRGEQKSEEERRAEFEELTALLASPSRAQPEP